MAVEKEKTAGTCQFCFAKQMLHKDKLVLHGYKRPGHGYTIGRCPGVDELPYQLSCDVVIRTRSMYIEHLKEVTKDLDRLQSGKVKAFTVENHDKPIKESSARFAKTIGYEPMVVRVDSPDERIRDLFEYTLKRAIKSTQKYMAQLLEAIEFRTLMIDKWELKPVIRWTELEEERKRKGKPTGVSDKVGALLLKMARKSKATFTEDEIVEALKAVGWNVAIEKAIKKITEEDDLHRIFWKDVREHNIQVWGYGGINEPKEFWGKTKDQAQTIKDVILAKPFVRIGKPDLSEDIDTLFIGLITGPTMEDAYGRSGSEDRWRVRMQYIAVIVSKLRATAPDGASEYVEGGKWWTFAYKHGLDADAQKYIDENTKSKPVIDVSEEEMEILVEPPKPQFKIEQ